MCANILKKWFQIPILFYFHGSNDGPMKIMSFMVLYVRIFRLLAKFMTFLDVFLHCISILVVGLILYWVQVVSLGEQAKVSGEIRF